MKILVEGNLEINFPDYIDAIKFDETSTHGLSCMKAVDFIASTDDCVYFIEFKDPCDPCAREKDAAKFINDFRSGVLDQDLKYKYRDSFLYDWALSGIFSDEKRIYYYILIADDSIDRKLLLRRTDALRKRIPIRNASPARWKRSICENCMVFNIETWNEKFPDLPVSRS